MMTLFFTKTGKEELKVQTRKDEGLLGRVNQTGSDSGRFLTGPNSNFEFEFKTMKNSQNFLKNTSRSVESNCVKNFQLFVHLYTLRALEVELKKKKRKNWSVKLLMPAKILNH
jgi:hypothetical protein